MNIIDYLPPHIKDFGIVCIFKTGSQLFCGNCKDLDFVIVTKADSGQHLHYINELKADCFIRSIDEFRAEILDDKWRYKLSACLAYHNPESIVYGELPELEIDILSRDYLLKIAEIEYAVAQRTYFAKFPMKTMVWGLAVYYVITNNSFEFTDEQKQILQDCHDLKIDKSYQEMLEVNLKNIIGN